MLLSQSIDILDEAGRRVFLGCKEGSLVFLGGGIAIFNNLRMDISSLVYAMLNKRKFTLSSLGF